MGSTGDGSNVLSSVPLDESDSVSANLPQQVEEVLADRIKREEHEQAVALRRQYGWTVLILTIAQVVAVNAFFLFDGLGMVPTFAIGWIGPFNTGGMAIIPMDLRTSLPFHPSEGVFKVFAVSVFASVIALGYGVTRSLFPGESGGGFWSFLSSVLGKKD